MKNHNPPATSNDLDSLYPQGEQLQEMSDAILKIQDAVDSLEADFSNMEKDWIIWKVMFAETV